MDENVLSYIQRLHAEAMEILSVLRRTISIRNARRGRVGHDAEVATVHVEHEVHQRVFIVSRC
jgi:hypothetical protein